MRKGGREEGREGERGERKREGERKGEETHRAVASHSHPDRGLNWQPKYMP